MKWFFLNNSGTLVVNLLLHEFFADKLNLDSCFIWAISLDYCILFTGNAGKVNCLKSLEFEEVLNTLSLLLDISSRRIVAHIEY